MTTPRNRLGAHTTRTLRSLTHLANGSVARPTRVRAAVACMALGLAGAGIALPTASAHGYGHGHGHGHGQRIVFTRQLDGGGAEAFTVRPDGSGEQKVDIPFAGEDLNRSVWSHDGKHVLFSNIPLTDTSGDVVGFRPATSAPDGSGFHLLRLPKRPVDMYCSAWSTDDRRVVCGDATPGLFSMRVSDGGEVVRLTTNPFGLPDVAVGFSPDGRRLAFLRFRPGRGDTEQVALILVRPDGSHPRRITDYGQLTGSDFAAADWSPDGESLISSDDAGRLVVVQADGSGLRHVSLRTGDAFAAMPSFSPDGGRIVFSLFRNAPADLYRANLDGSHVTRVTDTPANEIFADWGSAHRH